MSTKIQQLEEIAQSIYRDQLRKSQCSVTYGRAPVCCADSYNGGTVPYGYTLYPGTGWQKDIRFLGSSFSEAKQSLEEQAERMEA